MSIIMASLFANGWIYFLFTFALLATFGCGGALVLLQHDVTVAATARTRTNLFFALDMSILNVFLNKIKTKNPLSYVLGQRHSNILPH